MSSAYKLSDIHSSSLPLLEFVRDVGDVFQKRSEVPLRIVTILAGLTSDEISVESLQEIVKMLDGHTNLIERCSILITGKIQAISSDDGPLKVVCSLGENGEPQTLWIGSGTDAGATEAKKRRFRQPRKKRSALPKHDAATIPAQEGEGALPPKKKRRGRPRKNTQTAPNDPPPDPEGGDVIMSDLNPPQPSNDYGADEQPTDVPLRDETKVGRKGRGRPRKGSQTPPPPTDGDEKGTPVKRGRGRPRKKPASDNETQPVAEGQARGPRTFFRGRGRPRNNKSESPACGDATQTTDSAPP